MYNKQFLFSTIFCALGGVCLGLPFYNGLLFPLLFVAFVPLLLATRSTGSLMQLWIMTLVFTVSYNTTVTWWIRYATIYGNFIYNSINSLSLSVFLLLGFGFQKLNTSKHQLVNVLLNLLPLWCLVGFEYINLHWPFSWPWVTIGNAFGLVPWVVQWYEFTGALGGTFWVMAINLLSVEILFNKNKKNLKPTIALGLVSVFLPMLFSLYLYSTTKNKGSAVTFLIVQPNIDPLTEKFPDTKNYIPIEKQMQLFFSELPKGKVDTLTRYLVLPETAYSLPWVESYIDAFKELDPIYEFKNANKHTNVIIGIETVSIYGKQSIPPTYSCRWDESKGYYDMYNSVAHINEAFQIELYRKSKLLYGPEYIPFRPLLGFLEPIIIDNGGFGSYGWQEERKVFQNLYGNKVGVAICFESVFGSFISDFVKNGAEALVIITNDGWWGDSPGYFQHFQIDRLRAIENRKSIARCANNGISAFIDQKGNIISQTKYNERTTLKGDIQLNNKKTFYTKYGDFLGWISLLFAGITLGLAFKLK